MSSMISSGDTIQYIVGTDPNYARQLAFRQKLDQYKMVQHDQHDVFRVQAPVTEKQVLRKGTKVIAQRKIIKSFEVNDGIDMFGVFEKPLVKCHKNENLLIDYVRVIEYTKPGEQTQHVSKYSKLCFLPLYDPYSYDDDVDAFMNKYLFIEEKPPVEPEIVEKKVDIIEEKTVEVKVRKKKKVIEEIPDLKRAPLPKEKVEEKVFDEQAPQGIEWEVIHEHIREFQIGIAYRQYIEKVLKVEVELEGGGKKLETIKGRFLPHKTIRLGPDLDHPEINDAEYLFNTNTIPWQDMIETEFSAKIESINANNDGITYDIKLDDMQILSTKPGFTKLNKVQLIEDINIYKKKHL